MLVCRGPTWTVLSGLVLLASGSCTGVKDDQPAIAARPGATQQGGKGDPVDEDTACARLRKAEEDTRRSLNCPDLERPACPDYVRPAGTGCWTYAEPSLAACEKTIEDYVACADFDDQPCILTATPVDAALCADDPGVAGRGGSGGRGGAAGRAGSSSSPGGEGGAPGGAGGEAGS